MLQYLELDLIAIDNGVPAIEHVLDEFLRIKLPTHSFRLNATSVIGTIWLFGRKITNYFRKSYKIRTQNYKQRRKIFVSDQKALKQPKQRHRICSLYHSLNNQ